MRKTYYIGGSPCAGKSTIAEILSQKYDLYYFKVDDFLETYTNICAQKGCPICRKTVEMSAEQIWMRDPVLQCREEFQFYEEIFEYILADLRQLSHNRGMITEGAAYVPDLIKGLGIPDSQYISITPAKDFQVSHFKKREFVPYVLKGCRNMEQAFEHWMERDHLFAQEVQKQCKENGYCSIINDGSIEISELASQVAAHFGF